MSAEGLSTLLGKDAELAFQKVSKGVNLIQDPKNVYSPSEISKWCTSRLPSKATLDAGIIMEAAELACSPLFQIAAIFSSNLSLSPRPP